MGQSGENLGTGRLEVSLHGGNSITLHFADLEDLGKQQGSGFRAGTIAEEHARAERFIKPEHQQRFLAARYFLRQVLSSYTEEAPAEIVIAFSEREKPFLADHAIPFNLSHSGNFAVVGISRSGDLGVDIETRNSLKTTLQVASRIMTEEEYSTWQPLPETDKIDTFLQYWTVKEAILKAHGDGLLQDPRGIELNLNGNSPEICRLAPVFGAIEQWQTGLIQPPSPFPRVAWALRN